jgi:hypothetical protein
MSARRPRRAAPASLFIMASPQCVAMDQSRPPKPMKSPEWSRGWRKPETRPTAAPRASVATSRRRGRRVGRARVCTRIFDRHAHPTVALTFIACLRPGFPHLRGPLAFVVRKGLHIVVAKPHFHRYLTEWDFKWNTRKMKDGERATAGPGH